MQPTKFCINCKWCITAKNSNVAEICSHLDLQIVDPITGERSNHTCRAQRHYSNCCGVEAHYFTAK